MVTEFVHPDVGPLFAEAKTGLFAFPDKFFHEIMGPLRLQPTPIGRTGTGLAFQQDASKSQKTLAKSVVSRKTVREEGGSVRVASILRIMKKLTLTLLGNLLDPMESAWVVSFGFS